MTGSTVNLQTGDNWTHLNNLETLGNIQVDGNLIVLGSINGEDQIVTGIIAHAGGGQTNATLLTAGAFNNITTVATTADSVKLPPSVSGLIVTVSNQGANAAQIFGTSPDTINGVATGTGISIPVGAIFEFTCVVAGNWLQNVQTGGAFTGTFDGVLGGNTPAAASVTTLGASSTISGTAVTVTNTSNQLVLGTTRTLTLTAPTPASASRTVTLPDPGGADSVAYLALPQTFTGVKTFVAPVLGAATATSINNLTITSSTGTLTIPASVVVTGPATSGTVALINPPPQAGGSTLPVTAAMSGKTIKLDTAAGTVATLPAATGTGNKYKFFCTTTTTSGAHKILAVGSDYLIGNINGTATTALTAFHALVGDTFQSLQMPFAGSQPSGGIQGDWFEFEDVAAAKWAVRGQFTSGTSPTTPFNTATS